MSWSVGPDEWVVLTWTWIAMAVIIAVAAMASSGFKVIPSGLAGMFEHIYDWVNSLAQGMIGSAGRHYVPFTMTIFLLVLVSNWFGLLPGFGAVTGEVGKPTTIKFEMSMGPKAEKKMEEAGTTPAEHPGETHAQAEATEPIGLLEAPTGNINTTLALALISFLSFTLFGLNIHYQTVRSGGHHHEEGHDEHGGHKAEAKDPVSSVLFGFVSWLGHFVQPTPMLWKSMDGAMKYLLVPPMCVLFIALNIIEEIARVISLTLRLFGNIAGEHQVKVGLFIVMGVFGGLAISSLQTSLMGVGTNGLLSVVIWSISLFVTLIGALAGFVQAMVFMLLTISYISHAVVLEH